jgi:hypothetical protein
MHKLTKNGLGYILGDFFTNSAGRPARSPNLCLFQRRRVWREGRVAGRQLTGGRFVHPAHVRRVRVPGGEDAVAELAVDGVDLDVLRLEVADDGAAVGGFLGSIL